MANRVVQLCIIPRFSSPTDGRVLATRFTNPSGGGDRSGPYWRDDGTVNTLPQCCERLPGTSLECHGQAKNRGKTPRALRSAQATEGGACRLLILGLKNRVVLVRFRSSLMMNQNGTHLLIELQPAPSMHACGDAKTR